MPLWETQRWGALAILAFLGVSLATPALAEADESVALRVATIGYRLASAGIGHCHRRAPLTGLLLHDLSAYDLDLRPAASERFGLTNGIGVLAVVPGSPAQQVRIKAGDEIIALADVPVPAMDLPSAGKAASHERVGAFTGLLGEALARGPVKLRLRRAGTTRTVVVPQRMGCAARFAVLPGETPAAWSDGSYAAVSQALAQKAGDDELAFALAHEMGHVVLGHAKEKRPILASLGIAGAKTREREREADRLGTLITMEAGFSPQGAEALFDRLVSTHGHLSLTHPSVASRLAEIRRIAAGATITPGRSSTL